MSRGDGRGFARIHLSIWDGDFPDLSSADQLVYFMLLSSRDLSYCGVTPLLPKRLTLLSTDLTERKVLASLKHLAQRRYLVVDEGTAEVLVRTYVRHDGILKQPNLVRAMNKAYDKVHSEHIREAIRDELSKAVAEGFPKGLPEGIAKALTEGFAAPYLQPTDGIPSTFHLPHDSSGSVQSERSVSDARDGDDLTGASQP